MKIVHIAIWVLNLEEMKSFYENYFEGEAGSKYHNVDKNLSSYSISFREGASLQLMHKPDLPANQNPETTTYLGQLQFAISTGSEEKVDEITEMLEQDGYEIVEKPRTTGAGLYESVVLDPEGNRLEITA